VCGPTSVRYDHGPIEDQPGAQEHLGQSEGAADKGDQRNVWREEQHNFEEAASQHAQKGLASAMIAFETLFSPALLLPITLAIGSALLALAYARKLRMDFVGPSRQPGLGFDTAIPYFPFGGAQRYQPRSFR
jgi:hypothetical protein